MRLVGCGRLDVVGCFLFFGAFFPWSSTMDDDLGRERIYLHAICAYEQSEKRLNALAF